MKTRLIVPSFFNTLDVRNFISNSSQVEFISKSVLSTIEINPLNNIDDQISSIANDFKKAISQDTITYTIGLGLNANISYYLSRCYGIKSILINPVILNAKNSNRLDLNSKDIELLNTLSQRSEKFEIHSHEAYFTFTNDMLRNNNLAIAQTIDFRDHLIEFINYDSLSEDAINGIFKSKKLIDYLNWYKLT